MRLRVVACALALAAAAVTSADAHTGGTNGYAVVTVDGAHVRYQLTLWPAALPPPIAGQIQHARAGDAGSRGALIAIVRDKITLRADGRPCRAEGGRVVPAGQAESLTLAVDFDCGARLRELAIRDDLFDALGADYHTLARIDAGAASAQFAFTPETRETRVQVEQPGGRHGTASFVLLLRGGGWLSLAKIITAFTIAHSVTLALAVLDVVTLPDRLVEAVIALSIAAVAAENLVLSPVVARRWIVSFCFGLVHGFGFSAALRELGLPAHGLLLSLFGFNAGVEIGQAVVVAVALPSLALLRRTRWERRMVWSSSVAILLVGVILFVERAFF